MGQFFKIKDRVKNKVFGIKDFHFSGLTMGEKEREKEMNPSLFSVILEVPSIRIRQAKN